jgi:hypothetical protein
MDQILHIFKKDARRHWPEILGSLAILGLFTRHELHPSAMRPDFYGSSFFLFFVSGRVLTPALVLAWAFLIIRVIQSEILIGDRQWWITKPYERWKLFLAKLLFIFVFISVPLYHSQLFLLHKAGFSLLPYLWSVVLLQIALPCVLILFSILLACLTRNLGQAVLTLVTLVAVAIALAWLASQEPGNSMSRHSELSQTISNCLIFGGALLAPVWQYARRNAWQSRGFVCAALLGGALFGAFLPNGKDIEGFYPLVSSKDLPVQISIHPFEGLTSRRPNWYGTPEDVRLSIPASVSSVAPGTVVLIDGINISADTAQDSKWNHGWEGQYLRIWPEDHQKDLTYPVRRKEYDESKSKRLNLRVEIALSEYQETEPRSIRLSSATFYDDLLGTCRLNPLNASTIQCLRPIQTPGFMARYRAGNSSCYADDDPENDHNIPVSYAWETPHYDFLPDPGLNPVVDYSLWFQPTSRIQSDEALTQRPRDTAYLCVGSDVRIARPLFKRQFRIRLDLPDTRLIDLAETE